MAHDNHVLDGRNLDLEGPYPTREAWLRLTDGWQDPLPAPVVESYPVDRGTVRVVREDLIEGGTKRRWGDLLIRSTEADTLVYLAPRVGMAGVALARLAKTYDKRLVLFCPAAAEPSCHQLHAHALGAELRWHRIAAMPNLARIAKAWAEAHGALFIPLGLKHPLVTAVGVRVAYELGERERAAGRPIHALWCAASTGVLGRALQIAWPHAAAHLVAVARNLKAGEAGTTSVISSPWAFQQALPGHEQLPFPSVATYDAKVWPYLKHRGREGHLMWNVAADLPPIANPGIESARAWGEVRPEDVAP